MTEELPGKKAIFEDIQHGQTLHKDSYASDYRSHLPIEFMFAFCQILIVTYNISVAHSTVSSLDRINESIKITLLISCPRFA